MATLEEDVSSTCSTSMPLVESVAVFVSILCHRRDDL
jgi:hypothetical protein